MGQVVCFFPGQGAQFVGMGRSLYQEFPDIRPIFEEADNVLGYSLSRICFEGSLLELGRISHGLPAILTVSVALYRVMQMETGLVPDYMAGHSLGEYSALVSSGIMKFADALKMVRLRGELGMQTARKTRSYMMVVENMHKSIVSSVCREETSDESQVSIACDNAPSQFVLSGQQSALERVEKRLRAFGAAVTPILTSPPFHSQLMADAALRLRQELDQLRFAEGCCSVLSNVTAKPYKNKEAVSETLSRQIACPVRWREVLDFLSAQGLDDAIEIGYQSVLDNIAQANHSRIQTYCYGQKTDQVLLKHLLSSKGVIRSDSNSEPTAIKLSALGLAEAVGTKNRQTDSQRYDKVMRHNYEELEIIHDSLHSGNLEAGKEVELQITKIIKHIFQLKMVPSEEQEKRMRFILNRSGVGYTASYGGNKI